MGDRKMRCVAYVRVSTEKQELSPDAQMRAIRTFAESKGYEVAAIESDVGRSGGDSVEDRPGLERAIERVGRDGVTALVVAKRDRLARDVVLAAMVTRLVERRDGRILSADGVGNEKSPESDLLRGIVDTFAEYERAIIRTRTKRALEVLATNRQRYTRFPPYGYELQAGRYVEVTGEQAVMARVLEMRTGAKGIDVVLGNEAVAVVLNEEVKAGTLAPPRPGGRWTAERVRGVVKAIVRARRWSQLRHETVESAINPTSDPGGV